MSRRGWLLFAAMCLIWGIPYLLIRVAVRDFSPASLVFFRTVLGALVLLPMAVRRGDLPAVFGRWRPLLLYTAIEVTLPWWLLSTAEQHLSSALTGLLLAAVPLFGVALSRAIGTGEVFTGVRLIGLLIGLAGVAALVGLQVQHADAWAIGACLLTALGYAAGPLILSRRLSDLPAVGVVTASLLLTAAVWCLPAIETFPTHASASVVLSVIGLALVCTAAAFLVFFALIAEVGPTRATVITYVNPAVAILLGVVVLGESFTVGMAVGFPLVILGSILATRSARGIATPALLANVVDDVSVSG